jgi:wyosine [tRNA(Phe)-imidazoG37] synthetase (radical SAM superfamily)
MTINLQNKVIYGPVNSRRLGSSLGINVLSAEKKICGFNCVYCQYSWTKIKPGDLTDRCNFIETEDILNSVEKAMFALSPSPNYITLSGNGEATLHPEIDDIVEGITKLRNDFSPKSKTAILSNSMGVVNPEIRKSLYKLDVRIMKLDCADEQMFKIYNRPIVDTKLDSIIKGLSLLTNVTIQTLFTSGEHGNSNENHVEKWIEKLQIIKPIDIQIYTLDRGYPSDNIYPVTLDWLYDLEKRLNKLGLKSKAYN